MKLGLRNRDALVGFFQPVLDALDSMIAMIQVWSNKEHGPDGQHGDITASDLIITKLRFPTGQSIDRGHLVICDDKAYGRPALDFGDATYTQTSSTSYGSGGGYDGRPWARIWSTTALGGTGSTLSFGTSSDHTKGITTTALSILPTGSLGVNTTTVRASGLPGVVLDLSGTGTGRALLTLGNATAITSGAVSTQLYMNAGTRVAQVDCTAEGAANNQAALRFYTNPGSGVAQRMVIRETGIVTMETYGAGTATFDASGVISSVSDERVKDRIAPLPYGLPEVLAVTPVQHGYTAESGLDPKGLYGGFLSQDVQKAMPLAVGQDQRGYLTLADRPLIGALVNAVKELTARVAALEDKAKGVE